MKRQLLAFLLASTLVSASLACGGGGETAILTFKFSGGGAHSMMLSPTGQVYTCGYNGSGQLGIGGYDNADVPTLVSTLSDKGVIAIAAGGFHSLALCSDGSVYAWGNNGYGQLGNGNTADQPVPEELTYFADKGIIAISAGGYHSLALSSDGTCYAWGNNGDYQLGNGGTGNLDTPAPVAGLSESHVIGISGGWYHTLVLCEGGAVLSFGAHDYGQLGIGDTENTGLPMPVTTLTGLGVTAIAAGGTHSFALCSDGSVYAWGSNDYGELGLGFDDGTNEDLPVEVTALADLNIVKIGGGWNFSAALTSDGTLYTWGDSNYGKLGLGDTTNVDTPTEVTAFSDTTVLAFAACTYHMFAETSGGAIYSWGENKSGDLGTGDTTSYNAPQLITMP
ncbi:MAG: chromosome condensation regulator RCC1 [Candidatus Brocadiia bacterium]